MYKYSFYYKYEYYLYNAFLLLFEVCNNFVEMIMTKIRGNNDGPNGRNESYDIGSRKGVPRSTVVREIKRGMHPGAHVVRINGQDYARDNPDSSTKDNVNRSK